MMMKSRYGRYVVFTVATCVVSLLLGAVSITLQRMTTSDIDSEAAFSQIISGETRALRVLNSADDAVHLITPEYYLGSQVVNDNIMPSDSDDDGIVLPANITGGETVTVEVTASVADASNTPDSYLGVLNAWIDFDGDGSFDADTEQIAADLLLTGPYPQSFQFTVPQTVASEGTYARFRYGTERGIGPTGNTYNGEVEDYSVVMQSNNTGVVLITEVDPGTPDVVEIFNPTSETIDLTGWRMLVYAGTSLTAGFDYIFPSFAIPPETYVVINEVSGTDTQTELFANQNISLVEGGSGAVSLIDDTGFGIDFVRFGNSTVEPPTGTRWGDTNAPAATADSTLGREPNGFDTDTSDDLCVQNPTLFAANNGCNAGVGEIFVTTFADELNNDGDCSLREAIRSANTNTAVDACTAGQSGTADNIYLTSSTYIMNLAGQDEDAALTGDYDILGDTNVIGVETGKSVVDGNDIDRVFHITTTATVTFRDMTIRGGNYSTGFGGGIFNEFGNLTVTSMLFTVNTASNGGAIGGTGSGSTSIDDSIFDMNSAGNGGAIQLSGQANFTSTNTFYTNNTATVDGGAIKLNFTTTSIIDNNTFRGNSADRQGGGYFAGSVSTTLTNTTFVSNSALRGGGVVVKRWASGDDTDTTLLNNVTIRQNTSQEYGGGMFSELAPTTINNSLFESNTATVRGGGFMNVENATIINNSTFLSNTAEKAGGASSPQFAGTAATSITFNQVTFDSNVVTIKGGAYHGLNGVVTFTDSVITNNVSQDNGAGISIFQSTLTIERSTVSANIASQIGGGVDVRGSHTTDIINSTITGNTARFGGGIYNQNGTLVVYNATIVDNTSNGRGAGLYNIDANTTLNNTIIIGNNTFDDQDCFATGTGSINASNRNLSGIDTGCQGAAVQVDSADTFTEVLNVLSDYGGPTSTMSLRNNSPAIDAGNCSLAVDQRGFGRPADVGGIPNYANGCDIGAIEAEAIQLAVDASSIEFSGDWVTVYADDASGGYYLCSISENAMLSFMANSPLFSVVTVNRPNTGTYGIEVNNVLRRTVLTATNDGTTVFDMDDVIINPENDVFPLLIEVYPVDGSVCIDGVETLSVN